MLLNKYSFNCGDLSFHHAQISLNFCIIMKFYRINIDVGNTCPILEKHIWSGLAAGILGSAVGALSQASANKANQRIAAESNKLQYQMFQEGNKFNTAERMAAQDFNRQERLESQEYNRRLMYEQLGYNSPAAQAERLRQAGLNPNNVDLNGSASAGVGSMQSSPASISGASAAAAPQTATAYVNPLVSGSDIAQSVSSIANSFKTMREAEGIGINNETLARRNALELENLASDLLSKSEDRSNTRVQRNLYRSQAKQARIAALVAKFDLDHMESRYQMEQSRFQGLMQQLNDQHQMAGVEYQRSKLAYDIESATGLELKRAELKNFEAAYKKSVAEIGLLFSQTNLTNKQAETEIERCTNMITDTIDKRCDIAKKREIQSLVRADLQSQIRQRNASAELSELGTSAIGIAGKLAPLVPFGFGAFKGVKALTHLKRAKVVGNTITWK